MTIDKLDHSLELLTENANAFVTHWMEDDGNDAEDKARAEKKSDAIDIAADRLNKALDAARATLKALKNAAEGTSVFQLGEYAGNVMMSRSLYDALEAAASAGETAGIVPKDA